MGKNNNTGEIVLAGLVGAVIGTAAAVLYAPEKGSETRNKLKWEAEKATSRLGNAVSELKGDIAHTFSNGSDEIGYLLGSVIAKTSYSTEELIRVLEAKLTELKAGQKTKVKKKVRAKQK